MDDGDDDIELDGLEGMLGDSDENLDFDNTGRGNEQEFGGEDVQIEQPIDTPLQNPADLSEVKEEEPKPILKGLPSSGEDFQFLKENRVKFNCVDVVIKTY